MKVVFSQNAEWELEEIGDWMTSALVHVIHGARDYTQIVFANDKTE